jgi:hypothetical protein
MEYLPLALLLLVYVAAKRLRSFKLEVNFKDGDDPLRDDRRSSNSQLPPRDERERLRDGT